MITRVRIMPFDSRGLLFCNSPAHSELLTYQTDGKKKITHLYNENFEVRVRYKISIRKRYGTWPFHKSFCEIIITSK